MTDKVLSAPPYAEPAIGFRSRKSAQLCAWFAVRNGGHIEKLKLAKLIYLCERSHLERFEEPMLFDEMYSLPHGPICSSSLNGMSGVIHGEIWDDFLARNGNVIVAMRNFSRDELDELSDEDIDIALDIWGRLGHMTASQIRNYTHLYCNEYVEVESGRLPISYEDILRCVGSSDPSLIESEVSAFRRATRVLTQRG